MRHNAIDMPEPIPTFEWLSETLMIVRFGTVIDRACNQIVHDAVQAIRAARLPGVQEVVPAYASLSIRYQPDTRLVSTDSSFAALCAALPAVLSFERSSTPTARLVTIPVCYDVELGEDLPAAVAHSGLSMAAFVAAHAAANYSVAMLGFAPGFPYLLGLPEALHLPRRGNPRTRVAAGSVAIGGSQTGIYPSALPGGWHLIGRTPLRLFDAQSTPPSALMPGDCVRFEPITRHEFDGWRESS